MTTYRVISEKYGLIWSGKNIKEAECVALRAAVISAHTVSVVSDNTVTSKVDTIHTSRTTLPVTMT